MIMSSCTGSIVLTSTAQGGSLPPRGSCSTELQPRKAAALRLASFRNEQLELRRMGARWVHFDEPSCERNGARATRSVSVGHERLHLENRGFRSKDRVRKAKMVLGERVQRGLGVVFDQEPLDGIEARDFGGESLGRGGGALRASRRGTGRL